MRNAKKKERGRGKETSLAVNRGEEGCVLRILSRIYRCLQTFGCLYLGRCGIASAYRGSRSDMFRQVGDDPGLCDCRGRQGHGWSKAREKTRLTLKPLEIHARKRTVELRVYVPVLK